MTIVYVPYSAGEPPIGIAEVWAAGMRYTEVHRSTDWDGQSGTFTEYTNNGGGPRPSLVETQESYVFIDPDGSEAYAYKVRHRSATGLLTDFSDVIIVSTEEEEEYVTGIMWPMYVPDVDHLISLGMDSIAWQRSDSEDGSYIDLTATSDTAASLTGTVAQTFNLSSETFVVTVKSVTYTITFTGTDPLIISDVVDQCNAVLPGNMASDYGGKLKLTTENTGTAETIVIGDGTANSILGFDEGDSSVGMVTYDALVTGVTVYGFLDESGEPDYWYRYRFIDDDTDAYTSWHYPGQGYQASPVDVSKLCRGYIKLVDTGGSAYANIELLVVNTASADGVAITGVDHNILGPRATVTTDESGEASIWLLRGSVVDISIEGTGLVRRVTIPDAATVNLLDSSIADDDIFSVQTFDIPDAIRRSL